MRVVATAALCASAFVTVLAQANLAFTSTPSSVEAGKTITIKYSAESLDEPVTILLRKGDPSNLSTVAILTSSATGGSYQWTPSDSLVDGDDYALEILQDEDSNYTGEFSLSGGSKTSSSSSSSASATSSSSSSSASSYHASTGVPVVTANTTANATAHTTSFASGASSAGTGLPMTRNTTLSSATLTATTSSTKSTGSSTGSSSGAGFEGTSTGSSASSTATGAAVSNMVAGSPLALVVCAIAAILY